jgi:hypothetical protein
MKYLAIEKSVTQNPIPDFILKREAEKILEYYVSGIIENIYFNESRNAVLIFNAETGDKAVSILNDLPLVLEGHISFEIMSLHPYTGFLRLKS